MATVPSLPYTLQNGQVADATQVMADFNTIRNAVISNAAASGVNDDITQLLGLTTPLSPAQGGSTLYRGGTSTGSANAQVLATLAPTGFSLTIGNIVTWIAGFTNSGATTLNGNGTGATAIKKIAGGALVALVGAEIVSGGAYSAYYDGTQYQLLNPSTASGGSGGAVVVNTLNLKGSAPTATTGSWTVDQITVATALGGTSYVGTSKTFSFNGATVGANGMDTGVMPTSGDLAIYAIYNPSSDTWACLGTVTGHGAIYSGGNFPSGYTASALLWAGVTNSSAQFSGFYQTDDLIAFAPVNIFNNATSSGWAAQSLSVAVPAAAKTVSGLLGTTTGSLANPGFRGAAVAATAGPGGFGEQYAAYPASTSASENYEGVMSFVGVPIDIPQTIYWNAFASATNDMRMDICAYTI